MGDEYIGVHYSAFLLFNFQNYKKLIFKIQRRKNIIPYILNTQYHFVAVFATPKTPQVFQSPILTKSTDHLWGQSSLWMIHSHEPLELVQRSQNIIIREPKKPTPGTWHRFTPYSAGHKGRWSSGVRKEGVYHESNGNFCPSANSRSREVHPPSLSHGFDILVPFNLQANWI